MLDIVQQTMEFYLKKMRVPKVEELNIKRKELTLSKGNCFVTLYINGEVRGASGNISEIKNSIAEDLIENTVNAMIGDSRFEKVNIGEFKSIKIRVDLITNRKILAKTDEQAKKGEQIISRIEPVKNGILVIKKNYDNLAVILPNIDPKLISGKDYQGILSAKLAEDFDEDKYIIYEIETKQESNF